MQRLPRGRRRDLLEREYARLRAVLRWVDWTERAAAEFSVRKAALERAGTPVCDMDVIIASIALAAGAAVATRNARDFQRIVGLTVEDWA